MTVKFHCPFIFTEVQTNKCSYVWGMMVICNDFTLSLFFQTLRYGSSAGNRGVDSQAKPTD